MGVRSPGGRSQLPSAPTPLIGRRRDLELAGQVLHRPHVRVLTLTGPPGVGKTRLALALAAAVQDEFEEGSVFVDLLAATTPSQVMHEIARALAPGDPEGELEHVRGHIAHRSLLLVLDNFEHVLPAGPDVAALAAVAQRARILVTSRERLRIRWEHEFPVPPLEMPDRSHVRNLRRLAQVPAVALFVNRAQAVRPEFALSPMNAEAVVEICVRVDGLPLAIELAAARLKMYPPRELARRLTHQIQLLRAGGRDVPPRHRTLRAAIAWSHDLLSAEERVLFRRLSVFAGGWTVESAEAVCGEPGADARELLHTLIEKSLVQPAHGDAERFAMLESIREYAAQELAARGEAAAVRARHADHFASLADRAEAMMGTDREDVGLRLLAHERLNLHAALDAAAGLGDAAMALRLATGLGWYWYTHGYIGEGRQVLDRAVAASAGAEPALRAGALLAGGILAWAAGDVDHARPYLEEAASLSERLDDRRRQAIASAFLGHVARLSGDFDRGPALHRRAMALFEALGSGRGTAWALHDLGLVARDRGDDEEAGRWFAASLERFRALTYPWAAAWNCWNLGRLARRSGRASRAAELLAEATEMFRAEYDPRSVALCLNEVAALRQSQGDAETATRLLAAAEGLRESAGASLTGVERREFEETRSILTAALPAHRLEALSREGRRLTLEAAAEAAIAAAGGRRGPGALTPREHEVAALIAQGASNRAIARRLRVAERTVVSHIEHIMNKLAVNSRAEIAAWAVRAGLEHAPSE